MGQIRSLGTGSNQIPFLLLVFNELKLKMAFDFVSDLKSKLNKELLCDTYSDLLLLNNEMD